MTDKLVLPEPPVGITEPEAYIVDGDWYPRVTSIIAWGGGAQKDRILAAWRRKIGNAEADRQVLFSQTFGKALHSALEAWNLVADPAVEFADRATWEPWLPPVGNVYRPFVETYAAWFFREVGQIVAAERLLVSRRRHYAGTMDGLYLSKSGKLVLLDYKTVNKVRVKQEHRWQTAAYAIALWECYGLKIDERVILQFPRDNAAWFHTQDYPDHREDCLDFLDLRARYEAAWRQAYYQGRRGG